MRLILLISLGLLLFNCKSEKKSPSENSTINEIIPIEEARNQSLGTEVIVEGTITVASGMYASSISYGYAVQDETGGIYVVDSVAPMYDAYSLGEKVEVRGVLEKENNLLVIREIKAEKKGKGIPISPLPVKTGGVNSSNEGMIVRTSGVIDSLVDDAPYGYKIFLDDGSGVVDIFVNTTTGLVKDTVDWTVLDSLVATGLSSQYNSVVEIDPRIETDIIVISN